ncbi:TolC family protein [Marinoscillum furvescens]|uniref:Outer membrane protein TolC n=1 Tax=Marinoscillum furvescens DSM 4134 TaxID=1122208 RepID=A0A3D9L3Z8_MARFU|nr:TolC family protein [Marinoscillum furvescens]RED97994.1 outer membrane protein TolC [Marinoscillum furvescens DSM 4134]
MIKTLTILTALAYPQPDSTFTLQDALATALENNYQIRLERKNLEVAKNNNSAGNAGMLPTVALSGGANQSIRNTEQTLEFGDGPVTQSRDGAKSTSYSAGIDMEWTLFDGMKMFTTKDKLGALESTNKLALKSRIETTLADVIKAYFSTSLEEERLELMKSSLKVSEERVKISKQKYDVGKASKMEYLQAQVDLNTDKSALVKQQEMIIAQKLQLWQMLGTVAPDSSVNLEYNYTPNASLSLESLQENSLNLNPNLQFLKSQSHTNYLAVKEFRQDVWPKLVFNLGYNYSNQQNEVGVLRGNQATGLSYGLSANMTVFDGWNQRRQIQNARVNLERSEITYHEAETQIISSLRTAYLTFQNALQLITLEEQNLEVARENESIALERYRVGKSNALEIREAQRNAISAEVRYLEAIHTANMAEVELMRLSGQLLD